MEPKNYALCLQYERLRKNLLAANFPKVQQLQAAYVNVTLVPYVDSDGESLGRHVGSEETKTSRCRLCDREFKDKEPVLMFKCNLGWACVCADRHACDKARLRMYEVVSVATFNDGL